MWCFGWREVNSYALVGLHIKYEPPAKPRTCGGGVGVDGDGGWSKGILKFCFYRDLRLGTEVWTKLNKNSTVHMD